MFYQAQPDGPKRFAIDADVRLQGVLQLVGARYRRSDQRYVASDAQKRDAEILIDAGFIGRPNLCGFWDFERSAYHPGLDLAVYDRQGALDAIGVPPARPRNHPELPL